MKYFKKIALFGFGNKEEPQVKPIKPFKTYEQDIESLPTYALKRRLTKLQGRVGAVGDATMTDTLKSAYGSKVNPIIAELKSRGELS